MRLDSDDFELFGLQRRFHQDPAQLEDRWRSLQGEVHPDRFVSEGPSAQRLAMQWSVRVNEAYRRLKDPLQRAAYLCELAGAPVQAHSNTAMPADFLARQMEWREALEEAHDEEGLRELERQVAAEKAQRLLAAERFLDEHHDAVKAAQEVRALMFVERFSSDVEERLDGMQD